MSRRGLWFARLVPLFGLILHLAGVVLWLGTQGIGTGRGLIIGAWAGLIGYSLLFWARGDFIQQALNSKPWNVQDELQKETGRMAMTYSFFATLLLTGLVLGFFARTFFFSALESEASLARAGQAFYLTILTVVYIIATLPTFLLGVLLKPLDADEH